MRRIHLLLSALLLLAVMAGCGDGSGKVGASMVTVTVGGDGKSATVTTERHPLLREAARLLGKLVQVGSATAAIPANVTEITITITAPDMPTITRSIAVAGHSSITESFSVPNGNNRSFTVESRDAQKNLQFRGVRVLNLNGTPVSIAIQMENVAPPTFGGLDSATARSATRIDLAWAPGSDNVTPTGRITYLIYVATRRGGENFATPSYTTQPGVTSYSVTGLAPNTTYYFIVRADNDQGLIDQNVLEKSATTSAAADQVPPTFAGLASASADPELTGTLTLSWSAASDDVTARGDIVYLIFMATAPGGENFTAAPTRTTAAGATTFTFSGLAPGTYYFVVRARDASGNTDSNTVERSASTAVASVTATAGTPQSVVIGTPFGIPFAVALRDAAGRPLTTVPVTFSAPASGPSGTFANRATSVTVSTDAHGAARAPVFTANTITGSYAVTASAASLQGATFALSNLPSPPASVTAAAGGGQSAPVNSTFPTPLKALVRNADLLPLSGVPVLFSAPAAGAGGTFAGGVSDITVQTDSSGVATAPAFTANQFLGSYQVTASVGGHLAPAVFSLTNVSGAAVTAIAGTPQSTQINTAFGLPLQTLVTDPFSNPQPGVTVTFTSPSTDPTAIFVNEGFSISIVTDAQGVAAADLFALSTPGSYTVTASVPGLAPASFALTNLPAFNPVSPAGFAAGARLRR